MTNLGVFIGTDAEMVRTERHEIIFRRLKGCDDLEALWCVKTPAGKTVAGMCRTQGYEKNIRFAMRGGEHNDAELLAKIGSLPEYCETSADGELELIIGSEVYQLLLVEEIAIDRAHQFCSLKNSSIAACLCDWKKGTRWVREHSVDFGIEINTNKHMYIFLAWEGQFYVRAARYACTDKGVVFVQNTRIREYGDHRDIGMLPDNRQAAQEVEIDETMFLPDRCYIPNSTDGNEGIYWSLKSCDTEREEIVLHGCAGEEYPYNRDTNLVEEFFD
jgi:hypothetical protein